MNKTLMQSVTSQLQAERKRLEAELHRVTAALTAFGSVYLHGTKTKMGAIGKTLTMSAAARRKISLAQKARWAKKKADAQPATAKRVISAASRRKMAAAQRARWAKVKGGKKAG
ncbi:MAG: hypothetical protein WCD47_19250 [Candidatus Sulfotelmatobacter sp.]